jgi:nitrous oxidase accessory protein NosD
VSSVPRRTAAAVIFAALAPLAGAATRVACPAGPAAPGCDFTGHDAIQQAVDEAASGDSIRIKAGTYSPTRFRDVPFEKLAIRGFVVVEGKDLTLEGEPGAVIDGAGGPPGSALVARNAKLTIRDLTVKNLRYGEPEDDVYDGHGLFFIGGRGIVENVTLEKIAKMALTVRGAGAVEASKLRILDGHVGIWLEETAHLTLRDSLVKGNDSAGICAYQSSVATVEESRFEENQDDGLYAADQAAIDVSGSSIVRNRPFDFRAVDAARITIRATATPDK